MIKLTQSEPWRGEGALEMTLHPFLNQSQLACMKHISLTDRPCAVHSVDACVAEIPAGIFSSFEADITGAI